jgi:hypothetical protein
MFSAYFVICLYTIASVISGYAQIDRTALRGLISDPCARTGEARVAVSCSQILQELTFL